MAKEYLTVKEYAEIKGCSTQYIYRLLQTKLQPFVVMVEGRKCLNISVLKGEIANQSTNATNNETCQNGNNSSENCQNGKSVDNDEIKRINKRNEEIIDDLRIQLKEKDEQIKNQSEHIVELSGKIAELFENNQKLQLNYQLLLGNATESNYEEVDEEENEQGARAQEETIKEEPKKRSLFERLFK